MRRQSSYAGFDGESLWSPLGLAASTFPTGLVGAHAALRAHVVEPEFPCVGAKSAFNRHRYRVGLYRPLASLDAVKAVCHDLYEFSHEFAQPGDEPVTFAAMFQGADLADDEAFEAALWSQLQQMHALDAPHFPWDARVSADPASPDFSFSIGGRAFFIVGLHPQASRMARRAPLPTIVFNLHEQFEGLRVRGKYESMKNIIRTRDVALQGSINPVLKNFGEASEARQYSGRPVSDAWSCPFQHLHTRPNS